MSTRAVTRETRALADRICAAIRELEPTAQVFLYGSRARGDAEPDSDWDLLILVNGPVSHEREEELTDRLFELGLETDAVLSPVVHSREEWASPLFRAMPFRRNVIREGVPL